jgi:hypothetical protein
MQPISRLSGRGEASLRTAVLRNDDLPWQDFDSDTYWRHNYSALRSEDREILQMLGDFFCEHFSSGRRRRPGHGVDIGCGTNLYPALAMVPWVDRLSLLDYSDHNVGWVRAQLEESDGAWGWEPFWEVLSGLPPYAAVADPRRALARTCRNGVSRHNIFNLPRRTWQLGTMFFVAESMTADPEEFAHATDCFLNALERGAPFAAAFMSGSAGYEVGDLGFPAVSLDCQGVHDLLRPRVRSLWTRHVGLADCPLRPGYDGMVLALGTVK